MKFLQKWRVSKYKNIKLNLACADGDIHKVASLLNQKNLFYADIKIDAYKSFRIACEYGHLEVAKYLLTSSDLTEYADIHACNDYGFRYACANGHLDVVSYLLTSPDLKEHTDIHANADAGFLLACENGHLEVVKYLLTSPNLKEHADIHTYNDLGFQWACANNHLEVVKYLLSFNNEQCICFQETEYNFYWAVENEYDDVIIAMMNNLKNNNIMDYIACLPRIEEYNKELYEQVKNIEREGLEINSSVPELFL